MLRLNDFIDETFEDYRSQRNRPDVVGTSRLSPHLHFGEISARQVWHAVHSHARSGADALAGGSYLRELGWREFAYHSLHNNAGYPGTAAPPGVLRTSRGMRIPKPFRWGGGAIPDPPIVDAGMRQLGPAAGCTTASG